MSTIRIATRASQLAITQARWVAEKLQTAMPEVRSELVEITTTGDIDRTSPVAGLTEVGAFVRAIQQAVLDGRADVAVHSCKDLPVAGPEALAAVYPLRASPWDVLVGSSLDRLPRGARVGTGSPRRSSQLALLRADLDVVEIRGNVDRRIEKVRTGEYDAIVLAEAGLARLGRMRDVGHRFGIHEMVPAPAQGCLAVEAPQDGPWWEALTGIDDADTRAGVEVERQLLARTGAGCRSALGVHARTDHGVLRSVAFVADERGPRRAEVTGSDPGSVVRGLIAGLELDR